jgi:hypothetical protein
VIQPTSFFAYDRISETERWPGLASWWWDHRSPLAAVTPPARSAAGTPWCRANRAAEVDSAEQARREVRRLAQSGVDAIKVVS